MSWNRGIIRKLMAAVAAVIALGCGDDEPVGNAGSIEIGVTPATLAVTQGGSGSVTASLTRSGGFGGVVALAVTGLPAGITTTITPAQLSGTTAGAVVDVSVASTVAPGTYSATVTATATGVAQATAGYQVTVSAAPGFAMAVTPTALAIAAGASGNSTVNIERTNFAGGVTLELLNPPAGVTGAFNATPTTTNTSTLVVSVAANVAPGPYPLTIRGAATGLPDRVASLQLTVTPPPAGDRDVVYAFCDASSAPVFFAYQDGAGAWRAVTGSASGEEVRFAFTLTQGRGGVLTVFAAEAATAGRVSARVAPRRRSRIGARLGVAAGTAMAAGRTRAAAPYETYVVHASAAELAQDGAADCDDPGPAKSVRGTVAGVAAGQYGIVSLGDATELFVGGTSTNPVTFAGVPPGPVDFVGTRMRSAGTPPDKVVVFRNLDIPDGGALPSTIDFDGAVASVPASANATIANGAGHALEVFVVLVTANGQALMWFDLAPSANSTRPWAGLGPGAMTSGDLHGLVVFATPSGSGPDDFRVAIKYAGQVTDQSLALGPVIVAPTITQVAAGAYPRFRFQGTLPAEYGKGAFIDVIGPTESDNPVYMVVTGGWLAASGNAFAYDLAIPDVATLAGFPAGARLTAGANKVLFSPFGFTGAGTFEVVPSVGSESRSGTRGTTIIVP